jgi:ADP-ribosylglycohydrolase
MSTNTYAWGAVLRGVALGDAWGNPNEFRSIQELTRTNPRGPDLPDFLEVTDDTQMTLFLARALNASAGADIPTVQKAIAEQFLAYLHDPDFSSRAPGITVTGALRDLDAGLLWHEATDDYSDGCGTVMRVSPAAFTDRWAGIAAFSAAITHGTANGIASAILNTAVLRYASGIGRSVDDQHTPLTRLALTMAKDPVTYRLLEVGEWLAPLKVDLREGFAQLADTLTQTHAALIDFRADPWGEDPCLYGGAGWRAHECLATALLAVDALPGNPWEALRRAVTTDGDSDSIGAVAGGLLGAAYGPFWPDATVLTRIEPRYLAWIAEADRYTLH